MKKLLTLFLLVPVFSYAQVAKDTTWKTKEAGSYSFKYPAHWELDETGKMSTLFIVMSPMESDGDKFRENVNYTVQDLKVLNMEMNLDQFVALSLEQIENYIPGAEMLTNERVKSENGEYHKLIYKGDVNGFHLQFEQWCWVMDNKAYLLTLSTEQDKWKMFSATGEKVMASFKFKK